MLNRALLPALALPLLWTAGASTAGAEPFVFVSLPDTQIYADLAPTVAELFELLAGFDEEPKELVASAP